jgi:hypothetical protein
MSKHGCCADKACNDKTCMELPAGSTCGDCKHFRHCSAFYAHTATDTYCDFYPRRFVAIAKPTDIAADRAEAMQ